MMLVPKTRLSELQDENRLLKRTVKELEEQIKKLQEMLYEKDGAENERMDKH